MNKPRVLIVNKSHDDFAALLANVSTITVVGEAQGALQALRLTKQIQPDVVLLNVDTLCTGDVQLVARLNQLYPHLKLMLVSANHTPDDLALETYRQGVRAYLLKTHSTLTNVIEAVHALYRGEAVLSPEMAGGILDEIMRAREGGIDHVT